MSFLEFLNSTKVETAHRDINTGWICPICGKSHAPWVETCPTCSNVKDKGPSVE